MESAVGIHFRRGKQRVSRLLSWWNSSVYSSASTSRNPDFDLGCRLCRHPNLIWNRWGFFINWLLFHRFSSALSPFFCQLLPIQYASFDGIRQAFYADSRKIGKSWFFLSFRAFFVLRMVLVGGNFLYYNQPKSKEVLHKHSGSYNGRDYFESKYNKSAFGGWQ